MGPLQYMVVGFKHEHFSAEILPELGRLKKKNVIRVLDLLFVTRDAAGVVTSHELQQMLPDEAGLISGQPEEATAEWFTQDDIDVVGECLPDGSAVALLLFEHRWAGRLDSAVHDANAYLSQGDDDAPLRTADIERHLAAAAGVTQPV